MGHRKGSREGGMVSRKAYIPERGDAVWITLDPQAGHEQAGRRPALVLSPSVYNRRVGLALFCPITSQVKGYPFEVAIPPRFSIRGVVGADQVKSLDWRDATKGNLSPVPHGAVVPAVVRVDAFVS